MVGDVKQTDGRNGWLAIAVYNSRLAMDWIAIHEAGRSVLRRAILACGAMRARET